MTTTVAIEGAKGKETTFMVPPEVLTIVNDPSSPIYDERAEQPLDQALVDSIQSGGVMVPIIVRKNVDKWEVVDGRQRHRAVVAANKVLAKAKKARILLPCRVVDKTDLELMEVMISTNAIRVDDEPSKQAEKMQRAIEFGAVEDDLARLWGCTKQTVKNRLMLLDCTKKVQKAVDADKSSESMARDIAKIDLKRQNSVLDQLVKKGLTKGVAAKKAIKAAKTGNGEVPSRKQVKAGAPRMRSKQWVQGFSDALVASGTKPTRDQSVAYAVSQHMLGEAEALDDFPSVKKIAELLKPDGSAREEEGGEEGDEE